MSISPKDGLLFFGSLAVGVITGSLGGWVVTAWYEYTKQKNKEERKERNARELRNKAIIPTLALVALIAFFLYFFSFSAFLLQFTDQNSTIEKSTSQSNAIINKTVHIENTYYTNNFTNITSIENKFSQPNCDNGTMQINSNKIASSNTDPLKEIPGAWLREIAGLAIFILFCYILYKIHKSEKIEKMIFGIMAIIFAALFFVVIYWDPAWAAPFLTIGLLLMTVFSTVSNQRLVDLN